MAYLDVKKVQIAGIAACVPEVCVSVSDIYKWGGSDAFVNTTGISKRREADAATTSADLCLSASERLIEELGWSKSEIDALVFVSQTPDYVLPATSCLLQQRLGLSKECYTLDISLGCSGWVYALSVISSLMQNGTIKKGLLLAGDTPLKMSGKNDKSSYPLFGDAGTATAIEYSESTDGMKFVFNTDGSGAEAIIVRDGAYRNQVNETSFIDVKEEEGISRNRLNVELDGMSVFSFRISKAPKSVKQLCEHFQLSPEEIDVFTFHQANKMMNDMIAKKLKLPKEKVPCCLDEFGNTSCASIPLTLVTRERERLTTSYLKHIACGFGVGLSWGSVYFETTNIVVPELIEL